MDNDRISELKILHVEDSDVDAYTVQRALSKHPEGRYTLRRAHAMAEAEKVLREEEQSWDIILLDLELPDSHGRTETFKRIDQIKDRNIPVLVLTSVNDHCLALNLVDSGAEDYVRKSSICTNPEALYDAIAFAICRHKNLSAMEARKEQELAEKNQVIQWMSGSYSVQ